MKRRQCRNVKPNRGLGGRHPGGESYDIHHASTQKRRDCESLYDKYKCKRKRASGTNDCIPYDSIVCCGDGRLQQVQPKISKLDRRARYTVVSSGHSIWSAVNQVYSSSTVSGAKRSRPRPLQSKRGIMAYVVAPRFPRSRDL
jgi:hypothetical protein